uniref:Uncharacterized protein n=1 Tax=Vibrio sp. 23023 TaxID=452803 RepID=A9M4L9_9VIBR|nr:hypothetical protein [Vibrio sp. 23023]ABX76994.1 Conserved hypothetical protein [Vibrio sp. 23023]
MSKSFTANDAPLTDTPPHITELGHTQAERNRYFVFCLSLIGAVLLALSFSWYAFTQAMHNKEILFIKMMPNGTWQSVEYHAQDKQLFFKTTVDSLLARYAERLTNHLELLVVMVLCVALVLSSFKMAYHFAQSCGAASNGAIQIAKKAAMMLAAL